jgi:hypothetical protein
MDFMRAPRPVPVERRYALDDPDEDVDEDEDDDDFDESGGGEAGDDDDDEEGEEDDDEEEETWQVFSAPPAGRRPALTSLYELLD